MPAIYSNYKEAYAMKTFTKTINKRSRKAMIFYLKNHFRYNTMNGWNNSSSYACNLKIYNLGLENKTVDKLYELIQTEEFFDRIHNLIYEFGADHDFQWQANFNGRGGGYIVLYQGERKPSGYKSYCPKCGQKNYRSIAETGNICGRCDQAERKDFSQTHMSTHIFSGRSTDQNEDFEDWDMDYLRSRVGLVQEFDALADAIVAEAVYMAENYDVQEETIYLPQTRKVMAFI